MENAQLHCRPPNGTTSRHQTPIVQRLFNVRPNLEPNDRSLFSIRAMNKGQFLQHRGDTKGGYKPPKLRASTFFIYRFCRNGFWKKKMNLMNFGKVTKTQLTFHCFQINENMYARVNSKQMTKSITDYCNRQFWRLAFLKFKWKQTTKSRTDLCGRYFWKFDFFKIKLTWISS